MLLSITLLASVLAACGSPNEGKSNNGSTGSKGSTSVEASGVSKDGFPIVKEPITLKMMSQDVGVADWNQMPVLQEMEKLTGIKLQFQNAPLDSFATKKNLVFASGDLPDMFYAADLKPQSK